MGDVRILICCD